MTMIPAWHTVDEGGVVEISQHIFLTLLCCCMWVFLMYFSITGCMFCERHPWTPALIHIYVLEVIMLATRGYQCPCVFVCMCVWVPGWPARTFGCTPLPWGITGSGRSRASAWQRGRGLRITAGAGGVCVDACLHGSECVHTCLNPPRGRMIPLAIKPITSVIPQNCAVFDAGRWHCCCFHCPAGRMTMLSLWYFLVEGNRVVEEDAGGWERG